MRITQLVFVDCSIFQIVEGLTTCLKLRDQLPVSDGDSLYLKRAILINQTDEDKKNLQTMIKVFVTSDDVSCLKNALDYSERCSRMVHQNWLDSDHSYRITFCSFFRPRITVHRFSHFIVPEFKIESVESPIGRIPNYVEDFRGLC